MNVLLRLLIAACAGAALGTATFTPWLWPVAPLSIALLLHLVFTSSRARAFWVGQCFGFGLMGAVFVWGFDALPLDWLGINDPVRSFLIMLGIWGVYSFIIAFPVALWAYLMHLHGVNRWLLFTAPMGWVVGEFAHAFVHALSTWGEGSTLGVDLSFGFVGYAFSWSGFLWLARLGGVVTLSVAVVFFGTTLYLLWKQASDLIKLRIAYSVGFFLCIVAIGVLLPSPVTTTHNPYIIEIENVRIALVTTRSLPALARTDKELVAIGESLTGKIFLALEKDPDIIVLPEYARFLKTEPLLSEDLTKRVRSALAENNVLLIDSEHSKDDLFGAISFFDGTEILDRQEKRLLIPLGEYQPYVLVSALRLFGLEKETDAILKYRTYTPSREPFSSRLFTWRGVTLSVLACSELVSPFSYRAASGAGADILINVASHSWIRGSSNTLFNETMAMARVHVVFTDKIYIQASNFSPSYVIHPR